MRAINAAELKAVFGGASAFGGQEIVSAAATARYEYEWPQCPATLPGEALEES